MANMGEDAGPCPLGLERNSIWANLPRTTDRDMGVGLHPVRQSIQSGWFVRIEQTTAPLARSDNQWALPRRPSTTDHLQGAGRSTRVPVYGDDETCKNEVTELRNGLDRCGMEKRQRKLSPERDNLKTLFFHHEGPPSARCGVCLSLLPTVESSRADVPSMSQGGRDNGEAFPAASASSHRAFWPRSIKLSSGFGKLFNEPADRSPSLRSRRDSRNAANGESCLGSSRV
ncbi:uncharacterized protein BDZ83DRAFT_654128 [Colletotrichum acutatum]|uniref:Uncharacterized protein n=1 Tax=Glomerella acutata TaxID=27357 RepID=A0AAD8XG39_GLOAC|nr:uncharacterized protein BDZ83DRAFT_654128 [Colletotrichum acutatum]KAK1721464.1 hypothetical protein BDZ83DRAFT_654128 [Colletotrichum acutatum]